MVNTTKEKLKVLQFLEDYRVFIILFFCLPASYIFNLLLNIRKYIRTRIFGRYSHDSRVKKVQSRIQKWNKLPKEKRKPLCTSRPNWLSLSTTFFQKKRCHQISVDLNDILELDTKNMTVRVEPMVTVKDITEYLIPKGYTLAVTLEIADATLGGLAMATGMTTHSHKVGLYQENVISYEVVLSDGSLVKASRAENTDLYKALPWSHGSLGFLVAVTLKMIPVKQYIKLKFIPIRGQKNYCEYIRKVAGAVDKNDKIPDYVEATIFSRDTAVVTLGEHSDFDSTYPINNASSWYKPWFYTYVQSFLNKGIHIELIPLKDYLLRHNRSIFWVVESMIPFGNNILFRLLFGWLLPPKPAFLKLTSPLSVRELTFTKQVFQDIVMPINELENQINMAEKLFDSYPLLVYPCRIYDHGPNSGQLRQPNKKYLVKNTNYAMYCDLGIYGVPGKVKRKQKYNPVQTMRDMEKFATDIGGFSFLYADIFMTREEFDNMFDLSLYEQVRKKYFAQDSFPHLYDKVRPEINVFDNKYAVV